MTKFMNIVKNVFSRNGTYYVVIVSLIIASFNIENIKLGRMSALQDAAAYPALYVSQEVGFDEKMFRLAEKYYEAFLYSVPAYAQGGFLNEARTLSRSYAMLAICRAYLGFPGEAASYFKKALNLAPTEFWLNYNLGLLYFERGEYEVANKYFANAFTLNFQNLETSIKMDYFQYWPSTLVNQYQAQGLRTLRETIVKSYELSIVAYERMDDPKMVKNLAQKALRSGFGDGNHFFKYYAGDALGDKPNVDMRRYRYIVNPSVKFVPIGREKFFAMSNSGFLP